MGWLIALVAFAVIGWIGAIVERGKFLAEQQRRIAEGDGYRAQIRELATRQFTSEIRRRVREEEQERPILVPRDGWVQHDRGQSH